MPSQPQAQCFALAIIAAFLRAAVLGFMFAGSIKADLFNPLTVVTAFIEGCLLILWAERRNHRVRVSGVDDMTWTDALKEGFAQAVAMTPGGLALQRLHGLCLVPDSLWVLVLITAYLGWVNWSEPG